ncbi:MAG: DEAD/DEAH box helicase [Deltaproteobacteria bacterium]|nr:DEAD/DEAH box helicase [Deltaproteobacteria bacterium]
MKFSELNLPPDILKSIVALGYDEMTPVQEATYPIISAGHDLCALAETGSGKTAACSIPLIQKIDTTLNAIQGLVIVPTRELCIQYVNEIYKIGAKSGVVPFGVYGGFSKGIQVAKLNHEVHILVATPGRLIDLMYEGAVRLSQTKCVVLDEADELLQTGFLEDIEFILSCIIQEHQTLLFAATMDDDIKRLVDKNFRDPRHISLIQERLSPESIEHYFEYVHPKNKQSKLMRHLKGEDTQQVLIFCNARHKVDSLFRNMKKEVDNIEYIHAGLSQEKRSSIYRNYRSNKISCLIATDVAGRGLDFSNVSHVINWDFPGDGEQYTHRTGRSGRMGRKGKALTFLTKRDLPQLKKLIRKLKITPLWIGENPLGKDAPPKDEKTQKKKRHYRPSRNRRPKSSEKTGASRRGER